MRRGHPKTMRAALTAMVVLLAAAGASWSAESADETPPKEQSKWAFEFALPIWLPGNFGTLKVHDRVSEVHTDVGDVVDLLTSGHAFAGEGYFDLRYDRFFTFADVLGGYVDEGVSEHVPIKRFPRLGSVAIQANAKLKQVMGDFAVGYRLGSWTLPNRKRPFTLDLYAGARYYWFLARVRGSASLGLRRRTLYRATDVSHDFEWADPLVGVRWELPLLDCVSADFRADVGGFSAGSDLAWNVVGGLRYWTSMEIFSARPWIGIGYRALGFDRSEGDNEVDLQFRGPYASAGFTF